jgi:drug/metabolite transporter (DMT)-like permease
MIGILIIWLIAGILLVVFSGLMYYSNTFGSLGLAVILLLGIGMLLVGASHLMSGQGRRNVPGKSNIDKLKNIFTFFIIISALVFGLGALAYLLGVMEIYNYDPQMKNTVFAFLTIGVLSTIMSILSWVYVERSVPGAISGAISSQQRQIENMKSESEEIGTEIASIKRDISDLTEDAMEMGERARKELKRGEL